MIVFHPLEDEAENRGRKCDECGRGVGPTSVILTVADHRMSLCESCVNTLKRMLLL